MYACLRGSSTRATRLDLGFGVRSGEHELKNGRERRVKNLACSLASIQPPYLQALNGETKGLGLRVGRGEGRVMSMQARLTHSTHNHLLIILELLRSNHSLQWALAG